MPTLLHASISSVPAGAVSFLPSTVRVASGIFSHFRLVAGNEVPANPRGGITISQQSELVWMSVKLTSTQMLLERACKSLVIKCIKFLYILFSNACARKRELEFAEYLRNMSFSISCPS